MNVTGRDWKHAEAIMGLVRFNRVINGLNKAMEPTPMTFTLDIKKL